MTTAAKTTAPFAQPDSGGDAMVFFERPISLILILIGVGLAAAVALPAVRKKREEAFQEEAG